MSARRRSPFVPVNCSAIPEQLLEAEFFGYRKGAFTGATEDRDGFFQAANGGTLFLDEIGDLPLSMQSKLLRAIQERSVRPVGAVSEQPVNVRILSATHKDLGAEVQAGRFRQDLYYRLNVIQIRVPPLRERLEDLPAISERVLERIARDAGVCRAPRLTRDALASSRATPSRQRARAREPAASRGRAVRRRRASTSSTSACPRRFHRQRGAGARAAGARARPRRERGRAAGRQRRAAADDLAAYLDEVERDILVRALEHHRFNRTAAARASACRCARCAIAWRAWASTSAATTSDDERGADVERAATGDGGWWGGARASRRRTSGRARRRRGRPGVIHSISLPPGEYGGDAIERLFTNRLDWDAHPYFERSAA